MSADACSNCVHWDRGDQTYHAELAIKGGWGICKRSENGFISDYLIERDDLDVFAPDADLRMFAQDGSGYWAALVTHPDFSCSEFRRTPSTPSGDE